MISYVPELIFSKSDPDKNPVVFPASDVEPAPLPGNPLLREAPAALPELSEPEVVRHFTALAGLNYSVDGGFYPLGSCTMKYNPKVTEDIAGFEGFTALHPYIPLLPGGSDISQGALGVLFGLQEALCNITGMDSTTLSPLAGAHGELTGMLIVRAWHRSKDDRRKFVIVPDESHGTNPASAAMAGYDVVTIPTAPDGQPDTAAFREKLTDECAAVIMTCPNTLGIFSRNICEISELAHSKGALMYYDGANLNAILGRVKPGDIGFDLVHTNLHKTFAAPHGGGGPGAGPVSVKEHLARFLPEPLIERDTGGKYRLLGRPGSSIGHIAPFYGNFSVLLKSYAYILLTGGDGMREISSRAVLNANYMMARLKDAFEFPYNRKCMHECVLSAAKQAANGASAMDIAKYLIDRGFHPPTVYFPLIIRESMMIEPTETENRKTLDRFIEAMLDAARLAEDDPDRLREAPLTTPVSRPDEAGAARQLDVVYKEY